MVAYVSCNCSIGSRQEVRYTYMEQLKQLDSYSVVTEEMTLSMFDQATTPLVYAEWAKQLRLHPDVEFCGYILNGIAHGFRIGFDASKVQCVSAKKNMQSASQHSSVVEEYLEKEVMLNRVIGPIPKNKISGVQINRFQKTTNQGSGG